MSKSSLIRALRHILQAQELINGVIEENNGSLIRRFGHDLHVISSGLMTYGDNRENLATTIQGLDTIIEEEGISWRENGEPDDDDEKSEWLDKIEEMMPEPYKKKYLSSQYRPKKFYYSPLLTPEEEEIFRLKTKIL